MTASYDTLGLMSDVIISRKALSGRQHHYISSPWLGRHTGGLVHQAGVPASLELHQAGSQIPTVRGHVANYMDSVQGDHQTLWQVSKLYQKWAESVPILT
jgi:hypothetical protein